MILGSLTAGLVLFAGFAKAAHSGEAKTIDKVSTEKPASIQDVGIDEKLGTQLNLDFKFKDENGKDVRLGDYFDGKTPVIISPIYFSCPGLCNFHLNGLTDGLKEMDWSAGKQFKMIAISFDSREKPEVALPKKENYMKQYNRPGTESGWTFLTGDEENVGGFTKSVGFKYKWDEEQKEWAHASAAIVVSPQGKITRYLPGIAFDSKDIKFALVEAGQGKVGTFVDQLVLYCFHYNPQQSRYTIVASNIMKLGGSIMLLVLAIWLLPAWFIKRKNQPVGS